MIKSMNIAWWVQRWKELHPEKAAVLFEGSTITYHELHRRANRVSCWLQSLGIEKGDRVAVMMRNCPEFIDLYLACARLGAIFVPINFRLTGPELDYILKNAQPRLFVFGKEHCRSVCELELHHQKPYLLLACLEFDRSRDKILGFDSETQKFDGKKAVSHQITGAQRSRRAPCDHVHVRNYRSAQGSRFILSKNPL